MQARFQSSKFQATPAQIRVLRAIYRGEIAKTNFATLNRIHSLLNYPAVPGEGKITVKPEVVAAFNLDR